MLTRLLLITATSTLLALIAPPASRADVLFSTFGSGDTYANSGGFVTGTNSGSTRFALADRFTAGFSGSLSQLDVAVSLGSGASASAGFIDLQLAPNNPATNLPLTSAILTLGTIQTTSTTPAIFSLATASSAYLFTAGSTYWLILSPHDTTTNTLWDGATNANATASAYMSQTSGGQFVASSGSNAFRVSAAPAPEPSTWTVLLVATAFLPLWQRWQRRRRFNPSFPQTTTL